MVSALVAAPLASQGQITPSSGLPTLGDAGDMTLNVERRMGDRIAREIYRDPDYIDDPVLVEYVGAIWQPLLKAARERGELSNELEERLAWEVVLARDRSVNAFALPGGYLGVHLGLIAIVTTRDELASVLAHELTHVTQRHIARIIAKQSAQAPWVLGAMLLGVLAAGKNPDVANAAIVGSQAVSAQNQLNFSRDMEREADRIGYGVMAQAGFDPHGFVSMFDKLEQGSRLNDSGSYPYLRSHPLTTERIADMQSRRQLLAPHVADASSALEHPMVSARARVLMQPGVDALRAQAAEATATATSSLPVPRRAGVYYGATLASIKLRDFSQAQLHLKRLQALTQSDAQAARLSRVLAVELALESGDARRAMQLSDADPFGGTRRVEMLQKGRGMLLAGQAAALAPALQAWVAAHPRDAQAWQMLADVYQSQGQTLRSLRADAESRVAHLDYAGAMNRFRAAQDRARAGSVAGAVDHIEASIIDSRARQVGLLLKEQALER